eukprot:15365635-Ditylum_brightwellii.AAC.2
MEDSPAQLEESISTIDSVESLEDLNQELEVVGQALESLLTSFHQEANRTVNINRTRSPQLSFSSMSSGTSAPTLAGGTGLQPNPPATPPATQDYEWSDTDEDVPSPHVGGLMKQDNKVIDFTGQDPDCKVNIYSYCPDKYEPTTDRWICPATKFIQGYKRHKGPIHVRQFRLANIKEKRKVKTTCCTFAGPTMFAGVANKKNDNNSSIPLREFYELKTFIKEFRENTADFYDIENLDWSRQWFRNFLTANYLRTILLKVDLEAFGPKMLLAIYDSMHYMDAHAAQALKSQLKNLKLTNFQGENVPKCNQEVTCIL